MLKGVSLMVMMLILILPLRVIGWTVHILASGWICNYNEKPMVAVDNAIRISLMLIHVQYKHLLMMSWDDPISEV
jgi:hypothetical protein